MHVDQRDQGDSSAKPAADVPTLLSDYKSAQGFVVCPPASITVPRGNPARRLIRALHLRLRPTWFAERWMARQLRHRVDLLERGMSERLALGGEPTPQEVSDREALRHFRESLTPPLSGLVTVSVFVGVIVIAQLFSNLVLAFFYADQGRQLVRALGGIGLTPDASAISTLVAGLAHADLNVLFAFVMGLLASGYVIGRAPASGYRLARLALGEPDGLGVPRRTSELSRSVAALGIRETEAAVFAAVERRRPRGFPVDLAVKAMLAVGWVYLAILIFRGDSEDSDVAAYKLIASLALLRLLWLARASVIRGAGVGWLAVPVVVLVAGATIVPPGQSISGVTAADPALSLSLSLQSDLSGVDLRNRDLSRVYLRGKKLSSANLSSANLTEADLAGATLDGADLSNANLTEADLSDATLRGADLSNANLTEADLSDATLRGADLTGASLDATELCAADLRDATVVDVRGHPDYDKRTRWTVGFSPPSQYPYYSNC